MVRSSINDHTLISVNQNVSFVMTQWSCRTKWCKPQDGAPKSDQSEWRQWNMRTGGWFTLLILQLVNWEWSYSNGPTMAEIQRTLVGQQPVVFTTTPTTMIIYHHIDQWRPGMMNVMTVGNKRIEAASTHLTYSSSLKGKLSKCWEMPPGHSWARTRQQQQHDHNEWQWQTTMEKKE